MSEKLTLSIQNEHGETTHFKEIKWSDIEMKHIGSEERNMGAENTYRLSYEADEFEIECEVYEYPSGTFNHKSEWRIKSGNVRIETDNLNYSDLFVEEE